MYWGTKYRRKLYRHFTAKSFSYHQSRHFWQHFTATSIVNKTGYGFSTQRTDSVKTSSPVYLRNTSASYISQFDVTSINSRIREFSYSASFTFIKSSVGGLLWEAMDVNGAPISITQPVGVGTWTEVDASTNVENWTEIIV